MTTGKGVVGKVQTRTLASVKPNEWNPNVLTPRVYESLKHGLTTDGWIVSQALLIWGKDDQGVERNLIIDGEHRWRAATELGFDKGPMVVMDGLTEAQAKALTIKMDARRGTFDQDDLGELLREIQFELGTDNIGLELGFTDDDLMKLLAEPPEALPTPDAAPGFGSDMPEGAGALPPPANVRLIQLFFDDAGHEEFTGQLRELGKQYGTKTATETVQEAVKRALTATIPG